MEKRQEILNELNSIAPLFAHISPNMPYSVPAGYFEELPEQIVSLLQLPEEEFNLPNKDQAYAVPSGYFENLAGSIMQKIKEAETEFSINARQMPYSLPSGYFDTLPATILQKLRAEEVKVELATVAPLLNEIPKINVYNTPKGYFDTVSIPGLPDTKVVKMGGRSWIKYAAAAAIIGVLAVGAFIIAGKNNSDDNFNTAAYKKAINTNIDTAINRVNDKELDKFLKDNAVMASITEEESDKDLPEVKELMNLISDEELQQSLKEQSAIESSGS